MGASLARRLVAEGLGTALLLTAVVGSGIMAERLSAGNDAIALIANTIATGAALTVLIAVFAPLSGAHFNPAVSLVFALRREIGWRDTLIYMAVQFAAAILGVWLAHAMFALPVLEVSHKLREGPAQALSEFVATFGLVLTILGASHYRAHVPSLVGLYIAAAYWFTASTSFANPAVTIARSLSDSFAGIAPGGVIPFIAAQLAGAVAAWMLSAWLFQKTGILHQGSDDQKKRLIP